MNPFEFQAELARQWLALVGGVVSSVLTTCAPQAYGSGALGQLRSAQPSESDAPRALTAAPQLNPSLLFFNPMLAFAPWGPWTCPARALDPWPAFASPLARSADVADQVASTYRSAGGHAVATIIVSSRIDPRTDSKDTYRITPRQRDLN